MYDNQPLNSNGAQPPKDSTVKASSWGHLAWTQPEQFSDGCKNGGNRKQHIVLISLPRVAYGWEKGGPTGPLNGNVLDVDVPTKQLYIDIFGVLGCVL